MTASRYRQQRGAATQNIVARWFASNGWPYAESAGSGRQGTDVTGMPGLVCEVKARRDFRPLEWLRQHAPRDRTDTPITDAVNGTLPLAFVVFRPDGLGEASIGSWGVMMRLDDFTALLKEAGH